MRSAMTNLRPYVPPATDAEIEAAFDAAFAPKQDAPEAQLAEPVAVPRADQRDLAPRALHHGRRVPVRGPLRHARFKRVPQQRERALRRRLPGAW